MVCQSHIGALNETRVTAFNAYNNNQSCEVALLCEQRSTEVTTS